MTHLDSKDPVIEAYKRDLDESLIRESLKLTVQQRVDRLIALQIAADEFRQAGLRLRREKKKPVRDRFREPHQASIVRIS